MGMTATVLHCKRDARLKIKAVPEAAAAARTFVEETFTRWALRALVEDAKLIVSELISNSVAVTPGAEIWALLSQERDTVWICVWDSCPILPEMRACDPYAESGRGMRIVAALADENGAFRVARPQGKITWARLKRS
jgi:anti-sigma regulatory factor (Ser/Thr protein kinase)